jgi:parallel beta-helix repeat protein
MSMLFLVSAWVVLGVSFDGKLPAGEAQGAEIRVGIDAGDLRGQDHRALQAAVDYVAGLGGGTVVIGPGRYEMRAALTLRDHVVIKGTPGKTILAACPGVRTKLAMDGDANQRAITLADPENFRVGDDVLLADDRYTGGFEVTTATLTAKLGPNTFRISRPLRLDYMVFRNARAEHVFPLVGGWGIKHAAVEGLTLEGNRGRTACRCVDGCSAGGIFLFECENVSLRRCTVRNYHGDGISFQVSKHVLVEDCTCENNDGLGLHPGSGSQHPIVRRNRSQGNGGDGLFVCWRVQHGVFEENEVRDNKGAGISIGHKDTDNLFRNNRIVANGKAGVLFRNESEPMGAHRNVFERNTIQDNGTSTKAGAPGACIVILGHHHDLVFRQNTIGNTNASAGSPTIGILVSKHAQRLRLEDNQFSHVQTPFTIEATNRLDSR